MSTDSGFASKACGRTLRAGVLAVITVLLAHSTTLAQESQGQKPFEGKCYSCHNIGSGDKKGPDLRGLSSRRTSDWIKRFILSPNAVKASGDQAAAELFSKYAPEVMPDQSLSDAEMDAIIALIDELTAKNQQFIPAGAKLSREILPADAAEGQKLFTGEVKLGGGGASCIACHSVQGIGRLGGGTLGPDLTAALTKYRDPELISILQNPIFPTMASVFQKRPLSDEEIVKVFAFLQRSKQNNPSARPATAGLQPIEPRFVAIGFVSLSVVLLGFNLIWKNRNRGVREEIVRRARK